MIDITVYRYDFQQPPPRRNQQSTPLGLSWRIYCFSHPTTSTRSHCSRTVRLVLDIWGISWINGLKSVSLWGFSQIDWISRFLVWELVRVIHWIRPISSTVGWYTRHGKLPRRSHTRTGFRRKLRKNGDYLVLLWYASSFVTEFWINTPKNTFWLFKKSRYIAVGSPCRLMAHFWSTNMHSLQSILRKSEHEKNSLIGMYDRPGFHAPTDYLDHCCHRTLAMLVRERKLSFINCWRKSLWSCSLSISTAQTAS